MKNTIENIINVPVTSTGGAISELLDFDTATDTINEFLGTVEDWNCIDDSCKKYIHSSPIKQFLFNQLTEPCGDVHAAHRW